MKESNTTNPDERTRLNIQDSDGALIIVPAWPLPMQIMDGTILTYNYASEINNPYFIIDLSDIDELHDSLDSWIEQYNIEILNIAGPRESNSPGIYHRACSVLENLFLYFEQRVILSISAINV